MSQTPATPASLLFRLRNPQDHEAWVEFVSLYEPVAYRLLRRHGLQDADAREVIQELLLTVSWSIRRWDPAKERGSFRGWLRTVARNLVIHWLKQGQRRAIASGGSDMHELLNLLPASEWPEIAEFDREQERSLFRYAAEITQAEVHPTTWQAFWETAVVGTSPSDAAKKLGMTVGAVRVAKCRVLARLRAKLRQWEEIL